MKLERIKRKNGKEYQYRMSPDAAQREDEAITSCDTNIPSLWTNSYFVSTVGGAPLSVIKQYIENQKNV